MPIRDKEKNREYQKLWARKKALTVDKEAHAKRKKAWREARRARGNNRDLEYQRAYNSRADVKRRKQSQRFKADYGEYAEAREALSQLEELRRTDERFEAIGWVKGEKGRVYKRYKTKRRFVGNLKGREGGEANS